MWSRERGAALRQGSRQALRCAAIVGLAAFCVGCFRPLYGEYSVAGSTSVQGALAGVEVVPVEAAGGTPLSRMAVELRNALAFELGGGAAAPVAPTHRLRLQLGTGTSSLIVDPNTGRPEYDIVSFDAVYQLVEIATGRPVVTGTATSRISYDIPGQQQRFNVIRGQRDAQSRATRVVAEQIRTRLAAYFTTGS